MGSGQDHIFQSSRNADGADDPGKHTSAGQDRRYAGCIFGCTAAALYKTLEVQLFIRKSAEDHSKDDGQRADFYDRADTGDQAEHHDHRQKQGKEGFFQVEENIFPAAPRHFGVLALGRDVEGDDQFHSTHQQAGDHAAQEQFVDRAGQINSHQDQAAGGRNDRADGRGCDGNSGGILTVIALLFHGGDHQGADGCRIGDR